MTSVNVGGGSVTIDAESTMTANATANGAVVGGLSVAAMLPTAEVSGTTRGYVGEHSDIESSGGNVTITGNGTLKSHASSSLLNVGAFAAGGAVANSTVSGLVESFVGAQADHQAIQSRPGKIHVGTGEIDLFASSDMEANADTTGNSAGAVTLSYMAPSAKVTGTTRGYVRDNVDVRAGTLHVYAGDSAGTRVKYRANATAHVLFLSIASGAGANGDAQITGEVDAFLGAPTGVAGVDPGTNTINVAGTIHVEAASDMNATAIANGAGASGVSVTVMLPTAEASGKTLAYAGDGTDVSAGVLEIKADGMIVADSSTVSVTVGGVAGQGADATATVNSETDAFLGKQADVVLNSVPIHVGVSGPITLTANSHDTAHATANGGAGALFAVSVMFPTSIASGKTRVYVGPETNVNADTINGNATSNADSTAKSVVTNISAGGGTGVKAESDLNEETDAFIGQNANVTLTTGHGASLAANGTGTATSNVKGLSAGLIEIGLYDVKSKTNMHTNAFVDDGATFTGDALSLSATGTANPVVNFESTSVAIGGGGGVTIDAEDNSVVQSYVGPASASAQTLVTTRAASGLSVSATANSTVTPTSDMLSIGILADITGVSVDGKSFASARSFLGNKGVINAQNNGAVDFESTTNATARVNSTGFGGSLFHFASASGTATLNPTSSSPSARS